MALRHFDIATHRTHGIFDRPLSAQKIELLLALIVILCVTRTHNLMFKEALPANQMTQAAQVETVYKVSAPKPTEGMNAQMWAYLRKGLNYVEASGEEYPPDFLHPGGKAYGPLAMTPIAIEDVLQHFGPFARYTIKDVLSDPDIYEGAARSYADLLLRHYLGLEYWNMPPEKVFKILQRAWFLGPGLYKRGHTIPPSRQRHAQEYIGREASACLQF